VAQRLLGNHLLAALRAVWLVKKEVESYSGEELEKIFAATPPGWPTTAVKILLGTGMRLSELCGMTIEDYEDDGESAFLKVRHGKGAKFRRVPVSSRLHAFLHTQNGTGRTDQAPDRSNGRMVQAAAPSSFFSVAAGLPAFTFFGFAKLGSRASHFRLNS